MNKTPFISQYFVFDESTVIVVRLLQPLNGFPCRSSERLSSAILVTEAGIVILVSPVQKSKENFPIVLRPLLKITSVSELL